MCIVFLIIQDLALVGYTIVCIHEHHLNDGGLSKKANVLNVPAIEGLNSQLILFILR